MKFFLEWLSNNYWEFVGAMFILALALNIVIEALRGCP